MSAVPVHIVIPTHTTRHLAACVGSLVYQATPPASVTVTCDSDDVAIINTLQRVAETTWRPAGFSPLLRSVLRPHAGVARLNQVRNNGLRALIGVASDGDAVLVIDGDMVLGTHAVECHSEQVASGFGIVCAHRQHLNESDTAEATAGNAAPNPADLPKPEADELERRARRLHSQARLGRSGLARRLGLVKPHKPKLLGGHHAVRWDLLKAVNGYDEGYEGYGYDDDDLALRLHRLRPMPRVAVMVDRIDAWHLWHPSRAAPRPSETSGHRRFVEAAKSRRVRAPLGLDNPAPQHAVSVRSITE